VIPPALLFLLIIASAVWVLCASIWILELLCWGLGWLCVHGFW
jgi:hypothetical protein